jgi:hypothetical protein
VLNFLFWGLKAFPVVGTQENAIFLSKKEKIVHCIFFLQFYSSKPWIRIRSGAGIDPEPDAMRSRMRSRAGFDPEPDWIQIRIRIRILDPDSL